MVGQEGPSVYIQHVVSVTPYQLFWNCLVMCVICKASLSLHWCWVQGASMWNQMARCMPMSSLSWMLVRMDWCQLGCSQAYTWLFDFSHYLLVSNILDHVVGWNSIILQLVIIIELEEWHLKMPHFHYFHNIILHTLLNIYRIFSLQQVLC